MRNKRKYITLLFISLFLISFAYGIYRYIKYREYIYATPYDVMVFDSNPNSISLFWKTDVDTPTYVKLGNSEKPLGNGEITRFHTITLLGLKASSKYTFSISDGDSVWTESKDRSDNLKSFALGKYEFLTKKEKNEILIPNVEEVNTLPNERIYVVLKKDQSYSDVRSFVANKFGGVAIDRNEFNNSNGNIEILDLGAPSMKDISNILIPKAHSAEINCNQNVPPQSIDGVSKEGFANLATRMVAGRGKHYALECFNDVVYRAKAKGVDPAFALTIWLNESGASNYTQNSDNSGIIEDFGIHGNPSVPTQNFSKQIEYFLQLKHSYSCDGLTAWEAWGNMYRWGDCNEDNLVNRQIGIDYYKGIEAVYGWVTNGRKLPEKVVGLEVIESGIAEEGSLCCALKISNQDKFQGDYENDMSGRTCEQVWKVGRTLYGGKLEYSVEIKDKDKTSCEVKYDGVCCKVSGVQKWYPKVLCNDIVPNVYSANACNQTADVDNKCYFKDGKYQWLPISTGNDYITDISSKNDCEERNKVSTYKISLSEGVNFVGFDFNPIYKGAAMFASNLVEFNSDVLLVGNFQEYAWKDLIKKSEKLPYAGNDFSLEQNKGYLVVVSKDTNIELGGWKKSSTEYSQLIDGWNLVGGSLYTKSYKASALIKSLAEKNLQVNTVAIWNLQTGMFNYRRESNEDVYGEDITFKTNEAIFLHR